jgi:hypothetical protein
MMGKTLLLGVLAAIGPFLACGEGMQKAEKAPPATIAGTYQVSGATVDKESGQKRAIEGKVILSQEGEKYIATFDLDTTYPSPDGLLPTDVIGKGEGTIEGNKLTGTAETQLVVGTIEGVDTAFAFVPRTVSRRIVSESVASLAPDGTLSVEIENQPAEGEEQYRPTRTTLRGSRMPDANVAAEGKAD